LLAERGEPVYEPSTFRILQTHLARGLRVVPLRVVMGEAVGAGA
jgi:DNA polymerase-3 subunit epsilon